MVSRFSFLTGIMNKLFVRSNMVEHLAKNCGHVINELG